MSDRKYSVNELESLRRTVENKYLWGSYGCSGRRHSRTFKEEEKTRQVEELVRTHILLGHVAEDLIASELSTNKPVESDSTGN